MKIIKFSLKHPVSVLMIVFALLLTGLISIFSIKMDFLPEIQDHYLLVSSEFKGISAKEMKTLVTLPIESSLSSIKGIKNITSVTRDGLSLVTVELQWNTDIDMALTECKDLVDSCYEILPSGCSKPNVQIYNPLQKDTISIVVVPIDGDLTFCRYSVDEDIKPKLQRILGVSSIYVNGGDKEEIQVILDKNKLEGKRLSLSDIAGVLGNSNFEYPAGTIREGTKDFLFKTTGLFSDINEIEKTTVSYGEEGSLKISDIGKVEKGVQERKSFCLYNGLECVKIGIKKKNDSSPLTLSRNITSEIKNLNELYRGQFEFHIVSDMSKQLKESLVQLLISAVLGIVIAFFVLLYFLGSMKPSVLVASMIPLSSAFSIFILLVTGRTLNILSLSGMAIGIGMVIDPATVVLENIIYHLKNNDNQFDGYVHGTEQVALSSIGSTVTTVVVFLPFFFIPGILGSLFGDMAIAVISSISISCCLSLTYIPAVFLLLTKNKVNFKGRNLNKIELLYGQKLAFFIKRKKFIPIVITGFTLFAIILFFLLPKEMFPQTSSKDISINVYYPSGTDIKKIQTDAQYISELTNLKSQYYSNIRISGGVEDDEFIELSKPDVRKEKLLIECKLKNKKASGDLKRILDIVGHEYKINYEKSLLSEIVSMDKDLYICSAETLDNLYEKLAVIINEDDSVIPNSHENEYVFTPDRIACSRFGISTMKAAGTAKGILDGVNASSFYKDGKQIPIKVKLQTGEITNIDQILESQVIDQGAFVPLFVLGKIEEKNIEKIFYRYNRKEAKIINLSKDKVKGKDLLSLEKKKYQEMFANAVYLLLIVLLLLYCVMGAQFESFVIPLLILLAIPPAFFGSFFVLLIFRMSLNINSIIALVVLFGTVVNNAILLYENCLLQERISDETVIEASKQKLKPIIITTVSTLLALIPFTIDPLRRNSQTSMTMAIIGGLLISSIVVLFVIPPCLEIVLKKRNNK